MPGWFWKAWNDSVWSKVIASAIFALLVWLAVWLFDPQGAIPRWTIAILAWSSHTTQTPNWVLVILAGLAATVAARMARRFSYFPLGRPFDRLSQQQRQFLIGCYQTGSRDFSSTFGSQRWFEELKNWHYVEAQRLLIYAGGPWPYEVTEPAWQLLARLDAKGRLKL